mmetsp:Transcript_35706/g.26523  ORF Transcript_35706/g.26523 Transcript_35706/m.26523 type:complete len:115 (+) Transcript_35706:269-613(+)
MAELECFELEDRKHMQFIILELFAAQQERVIEALHPKRMEIVTILIKKYTMPGMATFVGSLLRLFTKSNKLIDSLSSLSVLEQLADLIGNPDFNISADSLETFKELLLNEREGD